MTDKKVEKNRIPFESLTDGSAVSRWDLPAMSDSRRAIKSKSKSQNRRPTNESIENVSSSSKKQSITAEELQKIAEDAKREGYAEGYELGLKKGMDDGKLKGEALGKQQAYNETKKDMLDTQNRLKAIITALHEPMLQQDVLVENMVVDIATNLAKHILNTELRENHNALYGVVHRALSALPVGAKNTTVYINEEDSVILSSLVPENRRDWKIGVDAGLSSGGCRVETKESVVDYSIEERLRVYLSEVTEHDFVDESVLEAITPRPELEVEGSKPSTVASEKTIDESVSVSQPEEQKNDEGTADDSVASSDTKVTDSVDNVRPAPKDEAD